MSLSSAVASGLLLAVGQQPAPSVSIFESASPSSESIVNLAILTFVIAGLIFCIVEGVLFYTIWRFRRSRATSHAEPPQVYGSNPIEIAWTVAPLVVVFFLVLVTTRTIYEVNAGPVEPPTAEPALEVTVVGRQWWWEYRYQHYAGRDLNFITANELHIPAGDADTTRPVRLTLESADVCHSFWVPRLDGKVDLIPGRTNTLWLQTTETGLFLGQCAEYCGAQHAHMLLRVVVETPAAFERWLAEQQRPAEDDPAVADGQRAFLSHSCINCHRVRGTSADGGYAPDLTHLMSRQTLASGMIENTPENLDRWIRDPQSIKPGCLMPAFGLNASEQDAVVRYLLTLR